MYTAVMPNYNDHTSSEATTVSKYILTESGGWFRGVIVGRFYTVVNFFQIDIEFLGKTPGTEWARGDLNFRYCSTDVLRVRRHSSAYTTILTCFDFFNDIKSFPRNEHLP